MDVYEFLKNNEKERSYKLDAITKKYLGAGKDDMPYELIGEVRVYYFPYPQIWLMRLVCISFCLVR